ncbi:unnamed protein product [Caenorhabditis brenneri]
MVAAGTFNHEHIDHQEIYSTHLQRARYDWDDRTLCRFAEALRPRPNRQFDTTMNMYLLGSLSINSVSHIIHHNNLKHGCTTVDQCGRLVVIMDARKIHDEYYDTAVVLNQVLNAVSKLEEMELRKGPTPPCHYANHGSHAFDLSK